jgi:V-type H+-transporting ATPase subunit a
MPILRSESMRHGTLVLPSSRGRHFINELGYKCQLQFEDMNVTSLKRNFRKHLQKMEDLERMLRYVIDELTNKRGEVIQQGSMDEFLSVCESEYKLETVEMELTQIYKQLTKFKDNNSILVNEHQQAIEEKAVCSALSPVSSMMPVSSLSSVVNIAGVIDTGIKEKFARTVFRVTRGNSYVDFSPMDETRSIFVVYFQSDNENSALYSKIHKIAINFQAKIYKLPVDHRSAEIRINQLREIIADKQQAVSAYERFIAGEIQHLLNPPRYGGSSLVEEWRRFLTKEKSIYLCLNLFEGDQTLRADCWFPASEEEEIRRLLASQAKPGEVSAMLLSDFSDPKKSQPPTFVKKNVFTAPFQDIVDTYGIPRYREINPALFACVSFPFLFGVMFGDIGHGSILLLLGVFACAQGDKLNIPELNYAKYLLIAMGIAAVYAGFMYSEFFSIGVNLFGTSFTCSEASCSMGSDYGAYPFGLDPSWAEADNMLVFVNSMKMKLSVLFGVAQMLLGISLKFLNSWNFKNYIELFGECIPQLIFMLCIFGYMDFMIMYKWTRVTENAPSLITTMLNMGLGQSLKDNEILYSGQATVQARLVFMAFISVPWLLFVKPLCLYIKDWNSESGQRARLRASSADSGRGLVSSGRNAVAGVSAASHGGDAGDWGEEEHDFSEIMLHQLIETIEFVLGSVSHTASYLRLWALSLAHQQLSIVFIQRVVYPSMADGWWIFNAISIYVYTAIFLVITAGVLLGVDVLECFLHTLRLHWVEFQSKFYKADGYAFTPFTHLSNLMK